MSLSKNSRERAGIKRKSFETIPSVIGIPNLIEIQKKSYERFLQSEKNPKERELIGLEEVFRSVFPTFFLSNFICPHSCHDWAQTFS